MPGVPDTRDPGPRSRNSAPETAPGAESPKLRNQGLGFGVWGSPGLVGEGEDVAPGLGSPHMVRMLLPGTTRG
jgi:hypothetical protein